MKERDRIATDQKENMSQLKQYLNFGTARIVLSKQQEVEQTPWPPPRIPICLEQENQEHFRRSNFFTQPQVPSQCKIKVVGKLGPSQVRQRKDGNRRNVLEVLSDRTRAFT